MKNITVSVDQRTYRRARIRAAELDTSVSALVREYLGSLVGDGGSGRAANGLGGLKRMNRTQENEFERQRRLMNEVIEEITANGGGLPMEDNLSREARYDRDAARAGAEEANRKRPCHPSP